MDVKGRMGEDRGARRGGDTGGMLWTLLRPPPVAISRTLAGWIKAPLNQPVRFELHARRCKPTPTALCGWTDACRWPWWLVSKRLKVKVLSINGRSASSLQSPPPRSPIHGFRVALTAGVPAPPSVSTPSRGTARTYRAAHGRPRFTLACHAELARDVCPSQALPPGMLSVCRRGPAEPHPASIAVREKVLEDPTAHVRIQAKAAHSPPPPPKEPSRSTPNPAYPPPRRRTQSQSALGTSRCRSRSPKPLRAPRPATGWLCPTPSERRTCIVGCLLPLQVRLRGRACQPHHAHVRYTS